MDTVRSNMCILNLVIFMKHLWCFRVSLGGGAWPNYRLIVIKWSMMGGYMNAVSRVWHWIRVSRMTVVWVRVVGWQYSMKDSDIQNSTHT